MTDAAAMSPPKQEDRLSDGNGHPRHPIRPLHRMGWIALCIFGGPIIGFALAVAVDFFSRGLGGAVCLLVWSGSWLAGLGLAVAWPFQAARRRRAASPLWGWYPDPLDQDRRRYWDGTRWDDSTHPRMDARLDSPSQQHPVQPVRIGHRGWRIAEESWTVLRRNPGLLAFPVVSGIALWAVTAAFGIPAALVTDSEAVRRVPDGVQVGVTYAVIFAWYFVCTFVVVFCNAAMIFVALQCFSGHKASVRVGMAAATKRIPQLVGWTFLAATVGAFLTMLAWFAEEELGFVGRLIGDLVEAAWGVTVYFAVPVVVVEGVGPIHAVERSSAIMRRTWGETLTGAGGLFWVQLLFALPAIALGVAAVQANGTTTTWVLVAIAVAYVLPLVVVFTTLQTVFRTSTYVYATSGAAPNGVDPGLVQSAFQSKKQ